MHYVVQYEMVQLNIVSSPYEDKGNIFLNNKMYVVLTIIINFYSLCILHEFAKSHIQRSPNNN